MMSLLHLSIYLSIYQFNYSFNPTFVCLSYTFIFINIMYLLIFNISILVVVHVLIVETFLVSHVVIQKKRNQLIGQKPTIFLKTVILCLWILMMTQNPQLKYRCRTFQTLICHHIVMIIIILRGVEGVLGLVNNLILRYQNQ